MKIQVEVTLVITVEAEDANTAFEAAWGVLDALPEGDVEINELGILTEDVPDGEEF